MSLVAYSKGFDIHAEPVMCWKHRLAVSLEVEVFAVEVATIQETLSRDQLAQMLLALGRALECGHASPSQDQ